MKNVFFIAITLICTQKTWASSYAVPNYVACNKSVELLLIEDKTSNGTYTSEYHPQTLDTYGIDGVGTMNNALTKGWYVESKKYWNFRLNQNHIVSVKPNIFCLGNT